MDFKKRLTEEAVNKKMERAKFARGFKKNKTQIVEHHHVRENPQPRETVSVKPTTKTEEDRCAHKKNGKAGCLQDKNILL